MEASTTGDLNLILVKSASPVENNLAQRKRSLENSKSATNSKKLKLLHDDPNMGIPANAACSDNWRNLSNTAPSSFAGMAAAVYSHGPLPPSSCPEAEKSSRSRLLENSAEGSALPQLTSDTHIIAEQQLHEPNDAKISQELKKMGSSFKWGPTIALMKLRTAVVSLISEEEKTLDSSKIQEIVKLIVFLRNRTMRIKGFMLCYSETLKPKDKLQLMKIIVLVLKLLSKRLDNEHNSKCPEVKKNVNRKRKMTKIVYCGDRNSLSEIFASLIVHILRSCFQTMENDMDKSLLSLQHDMEGLFASVDKSAIDDAIDQLVHTSDQTLRRSSRIKSMPTSGSKYCESEEDCDLLSNEIVKPSYSKSVQSKFVRILPQPSDSLKSACVASSAVYSGSKTLTARLTSLNKCKRKNSTHRDKLFKSSSTSSISTAEQVPGCAINPSINLGNFLQCGFQMSVSEAPSKIYAYPYPSVVNGKTSALYTSQNSRLPTALITDSQPGKMHCSSSSVTIGGVTLVNSNANSLNLKPAQVSTSSVVNFNNICVLSDGIEAGNKANTIPPQNSVFESVPVGKVSTILNSMVTIRPKYDVRILGENKLLCTSLNISSTLAPPALQPQIIASPTTGQIYTGHSSNNLLGSSLPITHLPLLPRPLLINCNGRIYACQPAASSAFSLMKEVPASNPVMLDRKSNEASLKLPRDNQMRESKLTKYSVDITASEGCRPLAALLIDLGAMMVSYGLNNMYDEMESKNSSDLSAIGCVTYWDNISHNKNQSMKERPGGSILNSKLYDVSQQKFVQDLLQMEESLRCSGCGFRTGSANALSFHKQHENFVNKREFVCCVCNGYRSEFADKVRNHIRWVHRASKYRTDNCKHNLHCALLCHRDLDLSSLNLNWLDMASDLPPPVLTAESLLDPVAAHEKMDDPPNLDSPYLSKDYDICKNQPVVVPPYDPNYSDCDIPLREGSLSCTIRECLVGWKSPRVATKSLDNQLLNMSTQSAFPTSAASQVGFKMMQFKFPEIIPALKMANNSCISRTSTTLTCLSKPITSTVYETTNSDLLSSLRLPVMVTKPHDQSSAFTTPSSSTEVYSVSTGISPSVLCTTFKPSASTSFPSVNSKESFVFIVPSVSKAEWFANLSAAHSRSSVLGTLTTSATSFSPKPQMEKNNCSIQNSGTTCITTRVSNSTPSAAAWTGALNEMLVAKSNSFSNGVSIAQTFSLMSSATTTAPNAISNTTPLASSARPILITLMPTSMPAVGTSVSHLLPVFKVLEPGYSKKLPPEEKQMKIKTSLSR